MAKFAQAEDWDLTLHEMFYNSWFHEHGGNNFQQEDGENFTKTKGV